MQEQHRSKGYYGKRWKDNTPDFCVGYLKNDVPVTALMTTWANIWRRSKYIQLVANMRIGYYSYSAYIQVFFFKILFIREQSGRDREMERQRQTPHWARSLMRGSIPGPLDHDLSWGQVLNQLSHTGAPQDRFSMLIWVIRHIKGKKRCKNYLEHSV